jgi:type IV pilus biogenesis protein CpaD/CtpE
MRHSAFALIALALTACADPVTQQAIRDTRYDAVRADALLAVEFQHGAGQLDVAQFNQLKTIVGKSQHAQRDEFTVVSDGSGGALQQMRAENVRQSLAKAGAQWVGTALEPAMAMGPNSIVIVRTEYRLGTYNCPDHSKASNWNPNEAWARDPGCADAYNFGQMLARPRDAVVGRDPGPADGTVSAQAVQRYREGRVRMLSTSGQIGGGATDGGAPGGGAAPAGTP